MGKGVQGTAEELRTVAILTDDWVETEVYKYPETNLGKVRLQLKIGSLTAIQWRVYEDSLGDGTFERPFMTSDIASDGKVSHRAEYHEVVAADFADADGEGYIYRSFAFPKCCSAIKLEIKGVGTVTNSAAGITAIAGEM